MKDLETRLRESLAERAEDAPSPSGLAVRARGRLSRRRTARAKVAGAVLLVVAVPVVVVSAQRVVEDVREAGGGGPRPGLFVPQTPFVVEDLSPDSPEVRTTRESTREITWRYFRFAVPDEWRAGETTAWCAKGRGRGAVKDPARAVPRIDLPDQERSTTVCDPVSGYGVTVSPAAGFEPAYSSRQVWEYDADDAEEPTHPDGAWLSSWYDDEWVVTVATPDPGITSRVVRSVRGADVDVNGCIVGLDESKVTAAVGPRGVGASLCRYTADGSLEDSERLTEGETRSALAAIEGAPDAEAADGCVQQQGRVVTFTPAGEPARLVRYGTQDLGSCRDGVESPTGTVELTPDVVDALGLGDLDVD